MASRSVFAKIIAFSLLANAFCVPTEFRRRRDNINNEVDSDLPRVNQNPTEIFASPKETPLPQPSNVDVISIPLEEDDDDDDDEFESMQSASTAGGSNLFSLINVATSLFSGSGNNQWIRNIIRYMISNNLNPYPQNFLRRIDNKDNEIELDSLETRKPTFLRVETESDQSREESNGSTESNEEDHSESSEEAHSESSEEDNNNGGEESIESVEKNKSKQISESNEKSENNAGDSDYDSDEPPGGGDGQGGGVLGILAGLSGGEDGQSDLGSLLATVGGIVANLSGDGFDLNSLIASGLGLFVGLLSEGEENPGAVLASYLLTSLDTISGGGAKNNGAYFGTFLSKLIKGISAAGEGESDETEGDAPQGSDSAGFFISLLMGLLGDMSKGSSISK